MARHRRRKHTWNPYTSEIKRLSIYPDMSGREREEKPLKPGDVIEVIVNNMDDRGRGMAGYRGMRVIVFNSSVGSKYRVRIVRVSGNTAYAEILETLSESAIEYK